jgi:hypothetical protein
MKMYTSREEWYPVHEPVDGSGAFADEWEIPEDLATRYKAAFAAFDAVSNELVKYESRMVRSNGLQP